MDVSGKTAFVTGAGRGIGKGCALELARHGADLIVNDRPGSPDLQNTVNEVRALGRTCESVEGDVFGGEGCEQVVADVLDAAESVDILISNPAYGRRTPFLELDRHEFERIVQATLTAGFHISQLVARHMVENGNGKIVFISSVQAERPYTQCCAYGAAKAGLNLLMQTIAVELSPYRINVNAIEPGWIDTPGEHVTFTEQEITEKGKQLPWGRLGLPAEIGRAATFLSSSDADYISGSILAVDGLFRYKDCIHRF
ncbi:MAG: SDR family oxidoreductase [Fuerstiella sp.]|nr:SDR family oxidoreductase [Fuerstiella sp.]